MSDYLILSIFPGIDGLGMGFEEEMPEVCVVRGPDVLWGGDIRAFHPPAGKFWGVIGGPPCQAFSRMAYIARARGFNVAVNLIPEYERAVCEAQPEWFLMENVPEAPEPVISGYVVSSFVLNNRWLGAAQNRTRRFSFGTRDGRRLMVDDVVIFENPVFEPAVMAGSGRAVNVKIGGSGKVKATWHVKRFRRPLEECLRLQEFPENFLADAPFTVAGKQRVIGNAVPRRMARAIAKAVRRAMEAQP